MRGGLVHPWCRHVTYRNLYDKNDGVNLLEVHPDPWRPSMSMQPLISARVDVAAYSGGSKPAPRPWCRPRDRRRLRQARRPCSWSSAGVVQRASSRTRPAGRPRWTTRSRRAASSTSSTWAAIAACWSPSSARSTPAGIDRFGRGGIDRFGRGDRELEALANRPRRPERPAPCASCCSGSSTSEAHRLYLFCSAHPKKPPPSRPSRTARRCTSSDSWRERCQRLHDEHFGKGSDSFKDPAPFSMGQRSAVGTTRCAPHPCSRMQRALQSVPRYLLGVGSSLILREDACDARPVSGCHLLARMPLRSGPRC